MITMHDLISNPVQRSVRVQMHGSGSGNNSELCVGPAHVRKRIIRHMLVEQVHEYGVTGQAVELLKQFLRPPVTALLKATILQR